jgi:hypothetical protein
MDYIGLLAAIQAILAATSVWQAERSYKRSQQTYESTFREALEDPSIRERAIALEGVLPPDVAEVFKENLDMCWDRYKDCIRGQSTPEEFEVCERAHQECICSNLRYMSNANGCLPSDLKRLWETFACGVKPIIC